MKRAFQSTASSLVTAGVTTALLLPGSSCFAAPTAALPWDYTLIALQDMLNSYVAPAAILLALSGAIVLYSLGGHDKQAGRLAGSGIGGCVALLVVQLLNYVFP